MPTEDPVKPLEVRFAESCVVERAVWANDRLYLLARNIYHPEVGMAVYVDGGKLYNWCGPLSLQDIFGIGRDPNGRFIEVRRWRAPAGESLAFGVFAQLDALSGSRRGTVDTNEGEGLVSFLPSRPGSFITNWRIGDVGASRGEFHSVSFKKRLSGFDGAADVAGDGVLVGVSAPWQWLPDKEPAGLWRIDASTGDVAPVRLRTVATRPQESPPAEAELLNPQVDQVSGVLADPERAGWFYVGIGDLFRGGRLLHVGPEDQCELVFRQETGPFGQIAGVPGNPYRYIGRSHEEAVLALACDSRRSVHFTTPRGMYRLGRAGPEFVGVPAFEEVAGFYISRSIPGFVLILSRPGRMATSFSRVHMVPVLPASTTQPAPGPREQNDRSEGGAHRGDEGLEEDASGVRVPAEE